jgi:AraC-like DNA-binding protein
MLTSWTQDYRTPVPDIHAPTSDSLARSADAGPELAATDPLSDALRAVRLTGAMFFLWDVSWPFATPVPDGSSIAPLALPDAQQIISYHLVVEGTAWGAVPGEPAVQLHAGDVLLIPHGSAYVMSDSADGCARAPLDDPEALEFFRALGAGELPFVIEDGEGDVSTRVVCGFLGCDMHPFNPVLSALPSLVRLGRPEDASEDRIRGLVDLALSESRGNGPGSRAVLLRLSELLFIEVVRRCVNRMRGSAGGWLDALDDPVVGPALRCLHQAPAEPWTLERLAARVGISRSRLVERFAETVGEPPMLYLTRWRMQLASQLLIEGADKVAVVAEQVGYCSESAFSRAFKRHVGVSPASWRRHPGLPATR